VHAHHFSPTAGVAPPSETSVAAPLRLIVSPAAIAASRDRHPCALSTPAADTACGHCGFVSPEPGEISLLLRALPGTWKTLLDGCQPGYVEDGACLRDEIHAITNRIDQLLASPDSILAPVRMNPPNALARLVHPQLLVALLETATTRLAALTDTVHGEQWQRRGRGPTGAVSIAELATLPLHRTHQGQTGASSVSRLRLVPAATPF
jgi:hypothetical protein